LLDEENAFPKQVEKAAFVAEQAHWLLKTRHPATRYAKDFKEFVVESLTLASFVVPVFPFFGEARGADSDFVPSEVHW